ncbi:MAG: glutaredoxin domain-containing protein [Bacteroidota bacterium]
MEYTLFISDGCESCDKVAHHLREKRIAFRVVDLSDPEVETPEGLLIVPALFQGGRLLAYGPDIPAAASA